MKYTRDTLTVKHVHVTHHLVITKVVHLYEIYKHILQEYQPPFAIINRDVLASNGLFSLKKNRFSIYYKVEIMIFFTFADKFHDAKELKTRKAPSGAPL